MKSTEGGLAKTLADLSIPHHASLLIALSGGADSVYLCLRAVREGLAEYYRLGAVHVAHGIRSAEETLADTAFVKSLCDELGIPLTVESVGFGAIADEARQSKAGIEETARKFRYRLLEKTRIAGGYDYVLLAHHADDGYETSLMRILEGAGAFGLRGIPEKRGVFLRPLLGISRKEIMEYLADGQFREDSSNADLSYKRNWVRRRLVPVVEEGYPGFRTALDAFGEKQADLADLVNTHVANVPWVADGDGWTVTLADFEQLPVSARIESCTRLWGEMTGLRRIPYRFFRPLRRSPLGNGVLLRGHGGILRAESGLIQWSPDVVLSPEKRYLIVIKDDAEFDLGFCRVVANSAGRDGTVIRYNAVNGPLIFRSRSPGDVLVSRNGRKSVKDLLNEWKVPERERWTVPVVADRKGVLAVLGKGFGGRDRYRYIEGSTDSTAYITIRLRPSIGTDGRQ